MAGQLSKKSGQLFMMSVWIGRLYIMRECTLKGLKRILLSMQGHRYVHPNKATKMHLWKLEQQLG